MEIRVPVFAGRRILKKESLWDIRDYTYAGWQLYYAEYTDGLLKGCEIHAEDGRLVIGKGMLKFHDFIYLLMEEEEVTYQPKNRWQVLKAEFLEDDTNLDYKAYRVRFFLDEELELGENQMEMCRFYLREGSALRDSYKNFADMSTEYDTVNLICATVAGIGEKTLHPVVVQQFGEEICNAKEKETSDFAFSACCLTIGPSALITNPRPSSSLNIANSLFSCSIKLFSSLVVFSRYFFSCVILFFSFSNSLL